jgi:hypothetical protein
MKNMVLVAFYLSAMPWASHPNLFENDFFHSFSFWGLFIKCRYSMDAPVPGSMMALAHWWMGASMMVAWAWFIPCSAGDGGRQLWVG